MKVVLPEVAIRVFAQMMGRDPTTDEQLTLRRLHDAYAGKDTAVAWWDTVHKFRLECMIVDAFNLLWDDVTELSKSLRKRDAMLLTTETVRTVVTDAAFYAWFGCAVSFVVGITLGAVACAILR